MTKYHARVERGDRYWLIHVPEVDRWTQARKYSEIEEMARDLIDVMGGDASADLDIQVTLPDPVRRGLEEAASLDERAKRAQSDAAIARREALRALVEAHGLSQGEVADALGMSKQRVSQLVNS